MAQQTKPPPDVSRQRAADALLHFARLVTAHAGGGLSVVEYDSDGARGEPDADPDSLATLADVVALLQDDLHREQAKAADVFLARVHDAVVPIFRSVQTDDEALEDVEERVDRRLRSLGIALTRKEIATFIVDRDDIREQQGPSQAAANAVCAAAGVGSGREIFRAQNRARESSTPPALGRLVSMEAVRRFVTTLLDADDHRRSKRPVLALHALRDAEQSARVLARHRYDWKEETRREALLEGPKKVADIFLALLRGEDPFATYSGSPEHVRLWAPMREKLAALGSHPTLRENPELLRRIAEEAATECMNEFVDALDVGRK